MEWIYNFLKKAQVFYLATNGRDGPDVRPMSEVVLHNGKLYFITLKNSNLVNQLEKNNLFSLVAKINEDSLTLYGELNREGEGVTLECLRTSNEFIEEMFPQYQFAAFYIDDINISFDNKISTC